MLIREYFTVLNFISCSHRENILEEGVKVISCPYRDSDNYAMDKYLLDFLFSVNEVTPNFSVIILKKIMKCNWMKLFLFGLLQLQLSFPQTSSKPFFSLVRTTIFCLCRRAIFRMIHGRLERIFLILSRTKFQKQKKTVLQKNKDMYYTSLSSHKHSNWLYHSRKWSRMLVSSARKNNIWQQSIDKVDLRN